MNSRYGIKTYSELMEFKTFEERLDYLKLDGKVGFKTFGSKRYLNQVLYRSKEWKDVRREVIIRDNGWDLACQGYFIPGKIMIHHINPITEKDIINRNPSIFDMENLICSSFDTHERIHYGVEDPDSILNNQGFAVRTPSDTCLWRK